MIAQLLGIFLLLSSPIEAAPGDIPFHKKKIEALRKEALSVQKKVDTAIARLQAIQETYRRGGDLEEIIPRRDAAREELIKQVRRLDAIHYEFEAERDALNINMAAAIIQDLAERRGNLKAKEGLRESLSQSEFNEALLSTVFKGKRIYWREAGEFKEFFEAQSEQQMVRIGSISLALLAAAIATILWWIRRRNKDAAAGVSPEIPASAVPNSAEIPPTPSAELGAGANLEPGDFCGDYEIQSVEASDFLGEVYIGVDRQQKGRAIIKRLWSQLHSDDKDVDRLLERARRASELRHPNIAEIRAVFLEGERICIAQEETPGQLLSSRTEAGPISDIFEILRIARSIGKAMRAAHEEGIFHGDLSGANVTLMPGDGVKVSGFGLALEVRRIAAKGGWASRLGESKHLSPEAELGEPGPSGDLFGIGLLLYQMVSGHFPFSGPDFLAQKRSKSRPPLKGAAEIPEKLSRLVDRLLEPNPADRPASAQDFLDELEACQQ